MSVIYPETGQCPTTNSCVIYFLPNFKFSFCKLSSLVFSVMILELPANGMWKHNFMFDGN